MKAIQLQYSILSEGAAEIRTANLRMVGNERKSAFSKSVFEKLAYCNGESFTKKMVELSGNYFFAGIYD